LPLPVSPVIKTVESVGATLVICERNLLETLRRANHVLEPRGAIGFHDALRQH
jgi:hypothetical protein